LKFKLALFSIATATLLTLAPWVARAEGECGAVPQNVLQLSASATVEVQQDLLMLTLGVTRDGSDAAQVQSQLRVALDAGLAEARRSALAGQQDVRTGAFNLSPRYGRDGKINGWQGTAELVLEGRDFARITGTAARIQTLNVTQVGFSLSREQRAKVETDAQSQAIDRFKARATELAKDFGFAGYALREVNVGSADSGFLPRPRMMAMQAAVASAPSAELPVEAGRSQVTVNVSGSVQLR